MAADTARVVRVDIATSSGLVFRCALDGFLRAEDNAVVTFEAHATAHAAVGFCLCLFLRQAFHTFTVAANDVLRVNRNFLAQVTWSEFKVSQEQLRGLDDFVRGTVFIIVHSIIGIVGAGRLCMIVFGRLQSAFTQLVQQVEVVNR